MRNFSPEVVILDKDTGIDGYRVLHSGKIVAIKPEIFSPEFRTLSHQLYIATSGSGCSPTAIGRAVYCTNLYNTDEKSRFERADILGVVSPDRIPKWAQGRIASLVEQGVISEPRIAGTQQSAEQDQTKQYQSVKAKIEEGRQRQKDTLEVPKLPSKKQTRDESEL